MTNDTDESILVGNNNTVVMLAGREGYNVPCYMALGKIVDDKLADAGSLFTGPELDGGWRALKMPVGVDDVLMSMSNGCTDMEAVLSEMLERGLLTRSLAEHTRWSALAEATSLGVMIETSVEHVMMRLGYDVMNMSAGTGFCESHCSDGEDDGLYVNTEWEELKRRIGIGKAIPPVDPALDSFSAALARGTLVGKKAKKSISAKKNAKKKKKVK